jgi:hypothetical protein
MNDWIALREEIKVAHKEVVAFYYEVAVLPRICLKRIIEPRKKFVLGSVSSIPNRNQVRQSFVSGSFWY